MVRQRFFFYIGKMTMFVLSSFLTESISNELATFYPHIELNYLVKSLN